MQKIHLLFLYLLISVSLFATTTTAQNRSIKTNSNSDTTLVIVKGRVVDDKGSPISFASIRAGKKANLVFTNEKGEFEMNLYNGSELIIGSAGFEEKEMTVSGTELLVQLDPVAEIMDIDVSSSQVVINGDITIDNRKARTMDSLNATDQIIQRDLAITDNENKLSLPTFVNSGGMLSMGVQLLKDGKYKYQFADKSGKIVFENAITIDTKKRMMNLSIPVIAFGEYTFELIQLDNGKKFSRKIWVK